METIELPSVADHLRSLPSPGAARVRRLHRFVELRASAEASAALQAAAIRARDEGGLLALVLTSADEVLARSTADGALDRLNDVASSPEFLSLLPGWVDQLRRLASSSPDTGACNLASALELWSWTMHHFRAGETRAASAVVELTEVLCPLLGARFRVLQLTAEGAATEPELGWELCRVNAARVSASVGAICAELVFGHRRHLTWDAEGCATCYTGDQLDDLEALMPGIGSGARMSSDVIEADGSHPAKAGPCARFDGIESFVRLRSKLDGCLTGARIAKDRAAAAIAKTLEGKI